MEDPYPLKDWHQLGSILKKKKIKKYHFKIDKECCIVFILYSWIL